MAVFGAIANATLADRFANPPDSVAGRLPERTEAERLVLDGDAAPGPVTEFLRSALLDASHHVFLGVLACALVLFGVLWLMPRRTEPLDVG